MFKAKTFSRNLFLVASVASIFFSRIFEAALRICVQCTQTSIFMITLSFGLVVIQNLRKVKSGTFSCIISSIFVCFTLNSLNVVRWLTFTTKFLCWNWSTLTWNVSIELQPKLVRPIFCVVQHCEVRVRSFAFSFQRVYCVIHAKIQFSQEILRQNRFLLTDAVRLRQRMRVLWNLLCYRSSCINICVHCVVLCCIQIISQCYTRPFFIKYN